MSGNPIKDYLPKKMKTTIYSEEKILLELTQMLALVNRALIRVITVIHYFKILSRVTEDI